VTEQEPELVFCCMVDYENVVAQIKKNSNEFLKSNKTEKNFYLNGSATSQRNKNKMQRNCTISKSSKFMKYLVTFSLMNVLDMDKNQMSYGTSQVIVIVILHSCNCVLQSFFYCFSRIWNLKLI
jgi:hypothetical protein